MKNLIKNEIVINSEDIELYYNLKSVVDMNSYFTIEDEKNKTFRFNDDINFKKGLDFFQSYNKHFNYI